MVVDDRKTVDKSLRLGCPIRLVYSNQLAKVNGPVILSSLIYFSRDESRVERERNKWGGS
jgi:hypothetical protein